MSSTNCLIYIKSGNKVKKSGKNRENYRHNRGKSELSHSQLWNYIRPYSMPYCRIFLALMVQNCLIYECQYFWQILNFWTQRFINRYLKPSMKFVLYHIKNDGNLTKKSNKAIRKRIQMFLNLSLSLSLSLSLKFDYCRLYTVHLSRKYRLIKKPADYQNFIQNSN